MYLVPYFWKYSEVKMISDNSIKGLKMDSEKKVKCVTKIKQKDRNIRSKW